jgi:hypothetical protein
VGSSYPILILKEEKSRKEISIKKNKTKSSEISSTFGVEGRRGREKIC